MPEPFGPTTTATPGSSRISTGSTNDLNPRSLIAFRCMRGRSIAVGTDAAARPDEVPAQAVVGSAASACWAAVCSASFFERPVPAPRFDPVDDRRGRERAVVRRPLDLEHRVDDGAPRARQALLQLGLVVDVRRQGVLDARVERGDDRRLDRLEAVLEVERRQRGLEQRREHVAVEREPLDLALGEVARLLRRGARPAAAPARRPRSSPARRRASAPSPSGPR